MKTLRDCKTEQDVFDYFVENWADCDIGEGALQDAFDKGLAGEEVTDEEVEEIAKAYGWGNADDYYIGMNEIGLEIKRIGLKAYIEENAMDEDDDWDDMWDEDEEEVEETEEPESDTTSADPELGKKYAEDENYTIYLSDRNGFSAVSKKTGKHYMFGQVDSLGADTSWDMIVIFEWDEKEGYIFNNWVMGAEYTEPEEMLTYADHIKE